MNGNRSEYIAEIFESAIRYILASSDVMPMIDENWYYRSVLFFSLEYKELNYLFETFAGGGSRWIIPPAAVSLINAPRVFANI